MRWFRFIIPLLMLASFLVSCSPEDPFIPTHTGGGDTIKNPAFLRFIHAASDGPAVEVYVGGKPFFSKAQGYFEFPSGINDAKYYPTDTSATSIEIKAGGSTLASGSIRLRQGAYYTAYFHGTSGKYRILTTTDTVAPAPEVTKARVRVVNLAPDSPPITIHLESPTATPLVSNLPYDSASPYVLNKAYPITNRVGIWAFDDQGKPIYAIPSDAVVLPGSSVLTLVIAGKSKPSGDDPFLSFTAFNENFQNEGLYGGLPLRLLFAAVRLANLTPSSPSTVDLAFLDSSINDYATNAYFRRNIPPGQINAANNVAPLGYQTAFGQQPIRPYFILSVSDILLQQRKRYPYRIEIHTGDIFTYFGPQPVLASGGQPWQGVTFEPIPNKRYTLLVFGPFDSTKAQSKVLLDNTAVPTGGNVRLRFFHGAFGNLEGKPLKIRVGGATSRPMAYGELPDGITGSFDAPPAGSIELLDENDNVIHTETGVKLTAGKSYTVFLSRGSGVSSTPDLVLTATSEDLDSQP